MKKELTRLFSVLLAAVLVFGTLPVSAMGTDVADPPASSAEESAVEESAVDDAAQPEEQSAEEENAVTYASNDSFYKIVHLDCGRKYFTKDWIIALLYEMQNDGYNQLQLAFGNDGLRFLLNDMTFTANEITYSNDDVVKAVKAGNAAQNSSGDESYLTQSEMDEIIDTANNLGIEIVPLLNLPGHANAILDIAGDKYNASGSDNTLNVADSAEARAFGMAIFQKYVDYFAGKGCKFFNFGADEYANDIKGTFSFNRLNDTQYQNFVSFINDLAAYVTKKGMTPRAFNDGFYFNNKTMNTTTSLGATQVCYWSKGWDSYNLAYASTIKGNHYSLINTNGAYYYVLGADDRFTAGVSDDTHTYTKGEVSEYTTHVPSLYTAAADFDNTLFADGKTVSDPAGSMFCIWCDYPNFETEQEVAANTRLVLRAMAQRMDGKEVDVDENYVVDNGFEADGTINVPDPDKVTITVNGNAGNTLTVGNSVELAASKPSYWTVDSDGVVEIESADTVAAYSADETDDVQATTVKVTALAAGKVTITATNADNSDKTDSVILEVKAKETKTITVGEGKDVTIHVDGQNLAVGDGLDQKTATVKTENTTATQKSIAETDTLQSGAQYLIVHRDKNLLLTNNSNANFSNRLDLSGAVSADSVQLWTWDDPDGDGTGTLTDANGKYLTIGDKSSSVGEKESQITLSYGDTDTKWTISNIDGYYLNAYDSQKAAAGWNGSYAGNAAKDDPGSKWTIYKYTPAAVAGTDITFTGVTKGTTTVEIGGVVYTINVVDAALFDVTPLKIEYWITNAKISADGAQSKELLAVENGVYSKEGIAIADAVPETGAKVDGGYPVKYLKTVRLTSDKKQTKDDGVDRTTSGDEFAYVRYWENSWSFSADRETWHEINNTDQIVAYYLQKTAVTSEVTTYVTDWGYIYGDWKNNRSDAEWFWSNYVEESGNSHNFVFMDFAVVYEDSTQNPQSFPVNNTQFFHADSLPRKVGYINFSENDDFEIWKVTVTDGTASAWSSASAFKCSYDNTTETTVWDESMGGEPHIDQINYTAQRTGKLIRVYVRAKVTEDSLTVNYIDDGNGQTFYSYNIAVKSGTLFDPDFAIDGTHNVVKNIKDVDQTVTSNLSVMTEIGAQYRYAEYTYVGHVLEDGQKVVNLHYNFTRTAKFVVDFGTPLKISPADIKDTLGSANITNVVVSGANHGTATTDDEHNVIFTPNVDFVKEQNGESLQITYKGTRVTEEGASQDGEITYTVYIYPASNVLYEENFLENKTDGSTWTKETEVTHTTAQQTQKAGNGDYYTFGYDNSYDGVTSENGKWSITGLTFGERSAPLTTTFYGDTFDLIGECANDSGRVLLLIKGVDVSKNKLVVIDTRYNDGIEGKTVLYQVPLAHVELGVEGTYDVKVYTSGLNAIEDNATQAVAMMALDDGYTASDDDIAAILEENDLSLDDVEIVTTAMNQDGVSVASPVAAMSADDAATYATPVVAHPEGTHVEINGFRVYRSSAVSEKTDDTATAKTVADNYPASEQNQTYWNILDVVKGEIVAYTEADNKAVTAKVQDYEAMGGPQNEIFLTNKNSVQFQIESLAGKTIYVSLRAVNGATKYNDNDISSITEMYYPITADENGIFTIACDGENMLAIGNVKLPSSVKAENIEKPSKVSTDALVAALNTVLYGNQEKEVFTPETFTVKTTSTKVIRNKVVTLKINVSSDVAYVTINGVKYTRTGLQGMFQKTRTIRAVYTVPKNDEKTYEIIAYNADGVASEAITKTVK